MADESASQPEPGASDRPAQPTPARAERGVLPAWRVMLHNDEANSFDHVTDTLLLIARLSDEDAVAKALEAHVMGKAQVLKTHRERAELYQQQFAGRNLTVTVEPEGKSQQSQ